MKEPLMNMYNNPDLKNYKLTDDEWEMISKLMVILKKVFFCIILIYIYRTGFTLPREHQIDSPSQNIHPAVALYPNWGTLFDAVGAFISSGCSVKGCCSGIVYEHHNKTGYSKRLYLSSLAVHPSYN